MFTSSPTARRTALTMARSSRGSPVTLICNHEMPSATTWDASSAAASGFAMPTLWHSGIQSRTAPPRSWWTGTPARRATMSSTALSIIALV